MISIEKSEKKEYFITIASHESSFVLNTVDGYAKYVQKSGNINKA